MKYFTKKLRKIQGPYFNDSTHILYPLTTCVSEKLSSVC